MEDNAAALSLFIFVRSFCQAWGITIGSTVLQNELSSRLPSAFLERAQVQEVFAGSLGVLWQVMIGLAGLGFLSLLMMKELGMGTNVDGRFGLGRRDKVPDAEAQQPGMPGVDEKVREASA
ncbi:hypothetical protein AURDEDRAFT_162668 [Auricularia subglabra TFB-10046 SS5]|nr:hypothetical protein AURDEDRAFT_162668 [Auricularia subglabra TFB-10046 SS5]